MSFRFEWDRQKAATNLRKHRVSFDEARTVFYDGLARIFDDPAHSTTEQREILIGYSLVGWLLMCPLPNAVKPSASSVPD